jgi:hypothetical protein
LVVFPSQVIVFPAVVGVFFLDFSQIPLYLGHSTVHPVVVPIVVSTRYGIRPREAHLISAGVCLQSIRHAECFVQINRLALT